ncbi:hypothetical protein AnigIFM63309_006024 [Aspergillus niger]|uniref:Uncharacterized protein n=1 Tax=Aspergillus welwitschiae TaxID=1341132 RepID=A0A3F3QJ09_9EURO|nr:hypothetical protein BDQ94DRAFT_164995 [Aspergillus welwitschiae]RDH39253.1 hypothetical protein BDQ94DRAFT_164995 [Aspergillus welwitschiae]GLA38716.1 hypothetical protein AnigIFM63309_006024 [Aspergillus niger]
MPSPSKRIILEKSRTVRRRYQRSNKRFQFTASQIARIEREQEREKRAQQLRDKEKKRVANKKKKAEKEARDREERRRLGRMGLPDPNAPAPPSSQPLLFNFIKKRDGEEGGSNSGGGDTEVDEGGDTEVDEDLLEDLEAVVDAAEADLDLDTGDEGEEGEGEDHRDEATSCDQGENEGEQQAQAKEEDEFSDCCSIFYDEDIIKETGNTTAPDQGAPQDKPQPENHAQPEKQAQPEDHSAADSFQDDTALLLEEFGHEYDIDEEFEQALVALDAV